LCTSSSHPWEQIINVVHILLSHPWEQVINVVHTPSHPREQDGRLKTVTNTHGSRTGD